MQEWIHDSINEPTNEKRDKPNLPAMAMDCHSWWGIGGTYFFGVGSGDYWQPPKCQTAALQLTLFPRHIIADTSLLLWDTPSSAGFTAMPLLLCHLGFPKQHSAPQPYWATLVSRTCHGLFHFIGDYDCLFFFFFPISCLSFPSLPSWKILHSSNANISPFWSLPWTLNANNTSLLHAHRETYTAYSDSLTLCCNYQLSS